MLTAWILDPSAPAFVLLAALLAMAADALLGDPDWLYRRAPHPVAALGRLIDFGEGRLNREGLSDELRFQRGFALTAAVVLLALAAGLVLAAVTATVPGGWILEGLLASTLIAFRGLYDHVAAVIRGLARSLPEGRAAVAHIVGRDPGSLDRAGVARAAIESTAENFSDGVVAPVFWYLVLGLPGLLAYKAINTLDSMLGHQSPRYEAFGKAAAWLDDIVNWLPARLSGSLFVAAAAFVPGASAGHGWRVMLRDAPRHRSPNAGWQEAAVAGALDFSLAGPRQYSDEVVDDHWMGGGRADLDTADVRAALRLYLVAGIVLAVPVAALCWAVF
jgi:adenosylcobinamide-phosphate synthase